MTIRPRNQAFVMLLALSMTLAMAASVSAQGRQNRGSQGTARSMQINFRNSPHWVGIPGTNVVEIRQGDRTDYDMFRYGRNYYAYNNNNNRWYMSRRSRGQFTLIDDRSVPSELRRVPRDHWRNYPTAWQDRNYQGNNQDRNYQGSGGGSSTMQVNFGTRPHWSGIRGTRVETVTMAERPNYDVFRYGGSYYAYDGNRWYTSPRESGQFTMIDDRSVPSEMSRVPRDQWRNYPAGWGDQSSNPPSNGNGQRNSRGRNNQGGRGHN